jgi:hypothetical protein
MRTILIAALLTSGSATAAFATDITIRDFAGHVRITQGDSGVDVIRAGKYKADISERGDRITIDGGLSSKKRSEPCRGGGISWDLNFGDRESTGNTRLSDYPKLDIYVPEGSNLIIENSNLELMSDVRLDAADLDISGCFDVELEAVDDLELDKSGSGTIKIGTVQTLSLEKSGAGDLEIRFSGPFNIEKSGSGDIEIEKAEGIGEIELSGSGDVDIAEFVGSIAIERSGSGGFSIEGGSVETLNVQSSGSGDVSIDADVETATIQASGSTDIYIKSVSGSLEQSTSGSAEFKLGSR